MKIVNVHRFRTPNVGDLNCCPADYFDIGGERHDIEDDPVDCDVLIMGGGGLLYNVPAIERWLNANPRAFRVAWGIGLNGQTAPPDCLGGFDLVGLRDWVWGNHYWVPCCSCMSPEFDKDRAHECESVIYDHHDHPVGNLAPPNADGCPRCNNYWPATMGDALDFLGRGQHVYTTSYHGWLWATLLGRTAIAVDLWRTSFYYPKWPCGTPHPYALREARNANLRFWELVQTHLGH